MFGFNGSFIGYTTCNQTHHFAGGDTESLFHNNLNSQSGDWYYRANPITYSYNNYGHRCKNIDELNFDNYILFLGCSNTEGIGLHLEHTYANIVSSQLNCDYYNMSLGGSGLDILLYNLIAWLSVFDKAPKAIIVQWPNTVRVATIDHHKDILHPIGSWNTERHILEFLMLGEQTNFFATRGLLTYKMIHNLVKSTKLLLINPSFQYSGFPNDVEHPIITFPDLDYARDLSHPGIESNMLLSQKILTHFE